MISINNISQIAYVTADIDRSVELFREKYAIPEFMMMRGVELGSLGTLDIAMAYLGDTMIELIAPKEGASAMYRRDTLDFDRTAHEFHHVGVFIDDRSVFDEIKADVTATGLKIVADVDHEVLDFFYVDATADLGHYIEYVYLHDLGKDIFATIPRI